MNIAFRTKSIKHKLVMADILEYVNHSLPETLQARRIARAYTAQRDKQPTIVIDVKRK